ncbi:MAG: L-threonylcarbamoyladenylate synthase type 1 TsaC [Alteromonadaceae bacterium]|jgi:tRNA threonylcarbamoyl adenosine modification protein (Sua5/YciO/YrdC/YwlC family)|uniref:Sua5/YciO/YrdC/YwlC family protein n=1 Tax=Rheinheimera aquimaris TaxID=412437 RepID=UPI000C57BB5F|nr:Sua5/YciO/YrdC/YwlC family protein [Rheinheimera aquimaris]MBJ92634.1 L-threonylcarbamoyladenylate synthase type 1 TsaC [Alteromonadaceae bacterium]HBN87761.1 L-threonylcarbamoyladenylate synthase type 1 TsaC [Rheinheimera sp.]|tara:strand:- start:3066 stop:3620 length:555 start_codon:yes stop_codon:yes gene_type:complete
MTALDSVIRALNDGGVIAYPTEAVFGLGCDPDNETAVMALLAIKQRPVEKGLILIAADYSQLLPYVNDTAIPQDKRAKIFASWPGHVSWVLPASTTAPKWITGQFDSIAVRVSAHPIVQQLCRAYGKPLVSTSANLSGQPSITDPVELEQSLGSLLSAIMPGALGGATQPSQIRNALTGDIVRS